jgi:hypothetical protein
MITPNKISPFHLTKILTIITMEKCRWIYNRREVQEETPPPVHHQRLLIGVSMTPFIKEIPVGQVIWVGHLQIIKTGC